MDDRRWHGRPFLSVAVVVAVFAAPVFVSLVASAIAAHALPSPHGAGPKAIWWLVIFVVTSAAFAASERVARRALPIAALLKMTLVFPDRAPRRLAVARRAGSTRDLERRVEELHADGGAVEYGRAAEQILALAAALNAHDRLTRGHSERVRALTDLIADELNLPPEERERLRWSALLHDIGKLAVHVEILNKAGRPTDEEWAELKAHPVEGAKLAAPLAGWLGPWSNTIVEHHEKYDGTGYPFGIAAEQISHGGRIVAVADAYETMTAVRSYKKAMSAEDARAELAACAGTHFDPSIVRALLNVSVGQLRAVGGPLAFLAELPVVNRLPRMSARAGRAALLAVAAVGAVTIGVGQLHEPSAAPAITTIAFTRTDGAPTITITGTHLGSRPAADPPYTPEGHPLCPLPPSGVQGFDYGTSLYVADPGANLSAGRSRPAIGELDCMGLIVTTFTSTSVVFHVGSGYGRYPNAFADGQRYEVGVNGLVHRGEIHYSG